jgi:hypothetical protein
LDQETGQSFEVWATCADKGSIQSALEVYITKNPEPINPGGPSHAGLIAGCVIGGIAAAGIGTSAGLYIKRHRKPNPKKKNKYIDEARENQFDE